MDMDGPEEQDGLSPSIRSYWQISIVEKVTDGEWRRVVHYGMRTERDCECEVVIVAAAANISSS